MRPIGRLTLEEKVHTMGPAASVPRLGIVGSPHIEGYHGVAQGGPSNWGQRNPTATTQFPQAYGLGATWDPDLIRRVAAQEALEATQASIVRSQATGGADVPMLRAREATQSNDLRRIDAEIAAMGASTAKLRAVKAAEQEQRSGQ